MSELRSTWLFGLFYRLRDGCAKAAGVELTKTLQRKGRTPIENRSQIDEHGDQKRRETGMEAELLKTELGYGRYQAVTEHNVEREPEWTRINPQLQQAVRVVSKVLPFRTNRYVTRELIDWDNLPNDPMFQLVFPQRGMLSPEQFTTVQQLLDNDSPSDELNQAVHAIRSSLNPHPAGQLTHNVPTLNGRQLHGLQRKYERTVLFFPAQGQTCHAYCTYCFRWAQFVGVPEIKFEARGAEDLVAYLKAHPSVTDVLITGGDPMVMKTRVLRKYIQPLLEPGLEHLQNIRVGTKGPRLLAAALCDRRRRR